MARTVRNLKIDTRSARVRLPVRREALLNDARPRLRARLAPGTGKEPVRRYDESFLTSLTFARLRTG
jgi:hypothetical protein